MLWDYSVINAAGQFNGYIDAAVRTDDTVLRAEQAIANPNNLDENKTNAQRYEMQHAYFGHLLNVFQSSSTPAAIVTGSNGDPVPVGAPNFHRVLDYVHTPSRFVATDTLLNPTVFQGGVLTDPNDPRAELLAPFNRVPEYREPGKVNLNTVLGQRLSVLSDDVSENNIPSIQVSQQWSDVYDGLMHRIRDFNLVNHNTNLNLASDNILLQSGHFGPSWRDIVLSRRGYADPVVSVAAARTTGVDGVEFVLRNDSPTFFANPFRSAEDHDMVPIEPLMHANLDISVPRSGSSSATMQRAHHLQPDANETAFSWGPVGDDDGNGLQDDMREARFPGQSGIQVPLFSETSSDPAIDAARNPGMHYMPLTRIDNLTTTHSGVFAVWITVGYFEVTPAPDWNDTQVQQKFLNQTGNQGLDVAQALYTRVYPQGYQLGKELNADTGDLRRQRGFYIIDRTRPVAFKPGEDVNVEDAILLRRRIE